MCGLNGIFAFGRSAPEPLLTELRATRDAMAARGPDGAGEWRSQDGRCLLGHRRLAIIDPHDRALQPMQTPDEKLTIAFNGEIYNFRELRAEEESLGTRFRTQSDTEVLLWLYRRHGRDFVKRLRGMFALAIHDQAKDGILLARDHFGIKPLYYACDGSTIRFASQVKAILAGGGVSRQPDTAGLVGFFMLGSVPEPFTWVRSVKALEAGHTLWIDAKGPEKPRQWYALADVLAAGMANPFKGNLAELVGEAIHNSLDAHLVADVEVGLFLSAGIDSGTLLAHLASRAEAKPRCITLGFAEFAGTHEDETILAAKLANSYAAPHHVRMISEQEFEGDLGALFAAMDQPSIDGVNTWFVSKAAHEQGLKVVLSGLGADEILGGYPSFKDVPFWHRKFGHLSAIPGAASVFSTLVKSFAKGAAARQPKLSHMIRHSRSWEAAWLLKRGLFLPEELDDVLSPETVAEGLEQLNWEVHLRTLAQPLTAHSGAGGRTMDAAIISAFESQMYMRNQLLRDSDWAGMAHSLEIRVPFVDVRLIAALAAGLSQFMDGNGKMALAKSPKIPLPDSIAGRAKSGFGVPTGRWMEGLLGTQSGSTKEAAIKGLASRRWAQFVARHEEFSGFAA